MKKITFLFLICCSGFIYGQTMVNDFEAGSDAPLDIGGGATYTVVSNPNPTGSNTTGNCLRVGRTSTNWWAYIGIDVNDVSISDTETKYISVMVHYPELMDIAIRFDAANDGETGGPSVRPINTYTNFNQWQEMIFEIKDSQGATSFSKGTLFRLTFHPDIGDQVSPRTFITNNTDTFGYVDQFRILDTNPLSNDKFALESNISIYQNASMSNFRVEAKNNVKITNVSLYNMLGNKVENISKISANNYDISNLSSGLYIVNILDDTGASMSRKLIKQ